MKINIRKLLKFTGIIILLGILSFIIYFCLLINSICPSLKYVRTPAKYEEVVKQLIRQEKLTFLPKTIPEGATDVQLYSRYDKVEREFLLLKFKVNKEYIENELKKHEFLNADTLIGAKQDIYFIPNDNGRISSDGFTFYVIKDKENEAYYQQYFPYFTAIGVDKNMEHIIYYYILPNDYNYEGARKHYGL